MAFYYGTSEPDYEAGLLVVISRTTPARLLRSERGGYPGSFGKPRRYTLVFFFRANCIIQGASHGRSALLRGVSQFRIGNSSRVGFLAWRPYC
jgi:hypothetical protein